MKKFILLTALSVLSLTAVAQEAPVVSPYSRYGVGLLGDRALGFNKGMAGTGIGMADGRQLNALNPASYARIDSLSFLFDIGMSIQNANLSAEGTKMNSKTAQFDYLAMGFRLAPHLGMSIGVLPFSNIGYEISSTGTPIDNGMGTTVTPTTTYAGSGGLHSVYAGIGYSPIRPLALGVNLGYLWGTMSHSALTSYSLSTVQPLRRAYDAEVRSYTLDAGLQYSHRLNRKHLFTLGLTYGLGHDLGGTSKFYNQRLTSSSVVSAADTLSVSNAFSLPQTFGIGLTWQWTNSLRVACDYQHQQWASSTTPTLLTAADGTLSYVKSKGAYTDMNKFNLGAEYLGNPNGFNWSSRVRYRFGLGYATPYTYINGQKGPKSYTAAIGIGLPIMTVHNARENYSYVNISAQFEHVKPQVAGQLTENYFRLSVGLSFNQRWFMKWKVD